CLRMSGLRNHISPAKSESATRPETMGSRVSAMCVKGDLTTHAGGEAVVPQLSVRNHETGPGAAFPSSRPSIWNSDCCNALLQCIWTPSGAFKSLHWRVRDFFNEFAKRKQSNDF